MAVHSTEAPKVRSSHAPAYVTSGTFFNFLDSLKEGLPQTVDKSLMPTLSGGTQSHLMAALKFLRLIEDNGDVTSGLKALVDARGTPAFEQEFKTVVSAAYKPVLNGLDIQKATPKTLRDSFRSAGADGSTTEKAVRFYLKAISECGIAYPKVLNRNSLRSNGRKKTDQSNNAMSSGKKDPPETAGRSKDSHPPSAGMIEFPIPMGDKTGLIRVRSDITMDQFPLVEAMLNAVRVLAQTNSEKL